MHVDRPSRYFLTLVALLGACGDPDAIVELDLEQPDGSVELLPGGEVEFAWTVLGGDAELVLDVVPLGSADAIVIYDENVAEGAGSFTWDGRDLDGDLIAPDVYDIEATLFVDGDPVDDTVRNLSVQGVTVTTPAAGEELTINGSDGTVDLHYVTVSQRVIHLYTRLGDDILIDDRTIPGELVPFERDVHFMGVDTLGAAVPEGDYVVNVDVTDDDDPSLSYRATGGTVHWRPNS